MEIIEHLVFLEKSIAEWTAVMAGRTISLEESPPSLQGGWRKGFSSITMLTVPVLCWRVRAVWDPKG